MLPADDSELFEVVEESVALAAAWNASKVLFTVGLIAKTMPEPQWLLGAVCLQ
jgi:hypothetical protein